MKKYLLIQFLFISIVAIGQIDTGKFRIISPPDSTPIGAPDGKLVSKEIDADGGTIASDDGRVELNFPAGALKTATTISIQPTKNLAPNGAGKSYSFEPSDIKFEKPVEIIFHYNDTEAEICPPDLMGLAIQDHTGKWNFFDYDDLDSTTKTLHGTIQHFSGASNVSKLRLEPAFEKVRVGDTTMLILFNISKLFASTSNNEVPLWYVNDVRTGQGKYGKIIDYSFGSLLPNGIAADYAAPQSLPDKDPVIVKLELYIQVTKKGKQLNLQKTFKSEIYLYDAYEIKITGIMDNTALGIGTARYTDTSRIVIRLQRNGSIFDSLENTLLHQERMICPPKCTCVYTNKETCRGPIHISGLRSVKFLNGESSNESASIFFKAVNMDFPIMTITCPKSGSMPPMPILNVNALPYNIQFEMRDGIQEIPYSDYLNGIVRIKITIRRIHKNENSKDLQ
jgi:hypothetical protein